MSFEGISLGCRGEDMALEYLQKRGFELVKRNLRLRLGEIDLLMMDKDVLVVVEVKTKSSDKFGAPQEQVNYFKQRKLLQLAKSLWQLYPDHKIRIDVVAINMENGSIEHIENAVEE